MASGPRQLAALGGRVTVGDTLEPTRPTPRWMSSSSCWQAFRGVDPTEMSEVGRVLRPGGRLLVVHDYGRDDMSRLHGDLPEYGTVDTA